MLFKEINLILEILSAIFIIAAILFFPLKNEIKIFKRTYHKLYISNIFFYLGNIFSMIFAILNGLIPLFIQLVVFQYFTLYGLKLYSNDFKINLKLLLIFNILLILLPLYFVKHFNIETTFIEIVAAILAISGSYFMNIKKQLTKSFLLYIFSDIIYTCFFIYKNIFIYSLLYFFFIIINFISLINNINRKENEK